MKLKENVQNLELKPVHVQGERDGKAYDYYKLVVKVNGINVNVEAKDQTGKALINAHYFEEDVEEER